MGTRARSTVGKGCLNLGLLSLFGGAACGGEPCTVPQVECHGDQLWQCVQIDSDHMGNDWNKRTCGPQRYCRVGTVPSGVLAGHITGLCAAAPDPEPSCLTPALDRKGAMSDCTADGRVVNCIGGFIEDVLDTCASPALCSTAIAPAACVVSTEADPRCSADAARTTTCQGDHALTCQGGYLLSDRDCGAGLCYTPSNTLASPACVAATTPDPRCTALPANGIGVETGCDGNSLFTCVDDLYTQAKDCGIDTCANFNGPGSALCL